MRKILTAILIALMALLPTMVQAKVTHLLPKPHSVVENGGTPFALGRKVTITDETGCVALQNFSPITIVPLAMAVPRLM